MDVLNNAREERDDAAEKEGWWAHTTGGPAPEEPPLRKRTISRDYRLGVPAAVVAAMVMASERNGMSPLRRAARDFEKTHCCNGSCNAEIPPGRAGRMCESCRAANQAAHAREQEMRRDG